MNNKKTCSKCWFEDGKHSHACPKRKKFKASDFEKGLEKTYNEFVKPEGQIYYCEACEEQSKSNVLSTKFHTCGKEVKAFYKCNKCGRESCIVHLDKRCPFCEQEVLKEALPSWEEELKKSEKLLNKTKNLNEISFLEGYIKGLKFIRQTIKTEREQAVKEVLEEIEKGLPKEMKKVESVNKWPGQYAYIDAYNESLNNVKDFINKLKEKYES